MRKQYRIGVDIGGTNVKIGVINRNCEILAQQSTKTRPFDRSWQQVAKDIAAVIEGLLQELDIKIKQCASIGIGSPGMIDHREGVVVFASNLGWQNIPLVAEMRRYFDVPIRLSNDANCAVLGEVKAGAAKGNRDVVLLTLGTGVGGGVIADLELQEGGFAGGMELGHTLLIMGGERCSCGRHGCLEAYASASALTRQGRHAAEQNPTSLMNRLNGGDLDKMNAIIPFKAARQGDTVAQQVVDKYIQYLGEGIVNFINIWRPEKVLLGGGLSNEGDPLIRPLNEYVRPRAFAGVHGYVAPIEQAVLGNDAGLIGAAWLE